MALSPASHAASAHGQKIKLLIVDDSMVVRRMMERWLTNVDDIEIVAIAVNGEEGVALVREHKPDVVVLDIEMPVMDGLTALPKILEAHKAVKVVMASTLTVRNGQATLKAMSLGAADFIPKPEAGAMAGAAEYKREIVEKIRALGDSALRRRGVKTGWNAASARAVTAPPTIQRGIKPEALFIASSTGGPQALRDVFKQLRGRVSVPVFVVQHMPATFTQVLAETIDEIWPGKCAEANHGEPARAGQIYIAPGDKHMTVKKERGALVTLLNQGPPVNYCRPAADPLFISAAAACGDRALCAVLTGMGSDGADGAHAVVKAKGAVIAQDEASSVVWGMPGAVVQRGLAAHVSPLSEIGNAINNVLGGFEP